MVEMKCGKTAGSNGLPLSLSFGEYELSLSSMLPITESGPFSTNAQGDYAGFNTGNGEKLSYGQGADLAWLCLAVASFFSLSGVESCVVTLCT